MILHDLQEDKFTKLTKALNEVFDIKFNFGMEQSKLVKIQETTNSRIAALRESGVDVSAKDFQKLLLISEGINMVLVDVTQTTQGTKMKIQENQDLDQWEQMQVQHKGAKVTNIMGGSPDRAVGRLNGRKSYKRRNVK